jgi:hypothetical protein
MMVKAHSLLVGKHAENYSVRGHKRSFNAVKTDFREQGVEWIKLAEDGGQSRNGPSGFIREEGDF